MSQRWGLSPICYHTRFFFKNPAPSLFIIYGPLTSDQEPEKSLEPFSRTFCQPTDRQTNNCNVPRDELTFSFRSFKGGYCLEEFEIVASRGTWLYDSLQFINELKSEEWITHSKSKFEKLKTNQSKTRLILTVILPLYEQQDLYQDLYVFVCVCVIYVIPYIMFSIV